LFLQAILIGEIEKREIYSFGKNNFSHWLNSMARKNNHFVLLTFKDF